MSRWLRRLVLVERVEIAALAWSFLYFFTLLCGYYILRPMRDAMGIAGGVDQLQWLFTGTFLAMLAAVPLFGWVASRYPRRRFVPYVYYFFIANLLLFFLWFRAEETAGAWVARAFFIWTSVYNLFVVSVFWSFLADLYTNAQAKRLFGFVAAGGTAGALTGPALTALLAVPLGATNLLLVSAGFLAVSVLCVHRLTDWYRRQPHPGNRANATGGRALGGTVLAGIRLVWRSPYLLGVCLFMLLFTTLSTFLYFQQAQIVRDTFAGAAERTAVFAVIDLTVNILTLAIQVFLTARLVKTLGIGWTLALVPLLLAAGFAVLALAPVFAVLAAVQVIRRAGDYAVTRPAREMLYVVLGREEKYKAKNFIDTVVYRGGDAVSGWAYAGLRALGLGLPAIAAIAVPLALAWGWVSWRLGREQDRIARQPQAPRRRRRRSHVRLPA